MKKPLLLAAAIGATAAGWQPAQLPQAAETTVTSAHSGRSYRIQTATIGEAPPAGYPVLYLLDGDTYFPYALPLAQTLLNPPGAGEKRALVLVGIGYPGGKMLDLAQRTRDYTPPLADGDGDSGDGGEQAAPGDEKRRRRAMVENARTLTAQLQQSQSDTTFTLLEGENHGSAAFAALKTLLQAPSDSAP